MNEKIQVNSCQVLSFFKHNPTLHLEHSIAHVILHFRQRERFPSIPGQCATLSNRMSATGDGAAGFLLTGGFREMLRIGRATVVLGSLHARVNAESICVVKVLRLICNFFETSFC